MALIGLNIAVVLLCVLQAALEELMCPHGVAAVLPTLFEAMLAQKWQTNEGACRMLQVRTGAGPAAAAAQCNSLGVVWNRQKE